MTRDSRDEDGALAAEYVVGLLSRQQKRAVEQRLLTDRTFAAQVTAWEDYFAGLNEEYGSMRPSDQVKASIDKRLFAEAQPRRAWWIPASLVTALLALAVVVGTLALDFGAQARLTAQLESDESGYSFAVSLEDAGTTLDIALNDGAHVVDRTFELWLIPPEGAPQSLGIFAQTARLDALDEFQIQEGAVLAVSLEPLGGSPTGAPTGPVLAVGVLSDA